MFRLVAAAALAACGLAAAPLSARADGGTTLILATALPLGNPHADQVLHPWADRVNKASAGVLTIEYDEVQPIMMATSSRAGSHFRTAPASLAEPIVQEWAHEIPNGEAVLAAYRKILADVTVGH